MSFDDHFTALFNPNLWTEGVALDDICKPANLVPMLIVMVTGFVCTRVLLEGWILESLKTTQKKAYFRNLIVNWLHGLLTISIGCCLVYKRYMSEDILEKYSHYQEKLSWVYVALNVSYDSYSILVGASGFTIPLEKLAYLIAEILIFGYSLVANDWANIAIYSHLIIALLHTYLTARQILIIVGMKGTSTYWVVTTLFSTTWIFIRFPLEMFLVYKAFTIEGNLPSIFKVSLGTLHCTTWYWTISIIYLHYCSFACGTVIEKETQERINDVRWIRLSGSTYANNDADNAKKDK